MKTLVPLVAACFFLLFVLTVFVPYPPALDDAYAAGFNTDDIETGLQYAFQRRLLAWPSWLLELVLLGSLALTGAGRRLADYLLTWTRGYRIPAALTIGVVYLALHECFSAPLSYARHVHSHAWRMSNRSDWDWFHDRYLGLAIDVAWETIVLSGFYALLIVFPRVWWLLAALGGAVLGIAYALLAPVLINPLFNTFTPLSETEWKKQEPRVQALIDKAGVPVQEILVMNASKQSNHTNAYFTGFGPTRRIVLYDTLLKNHTDAEIESILGHELGHWMHDHIVKGIVLGTILAAFACFVLHFILRAAVGRAPWHLQSIADPGGLPLVLLLLNFASWASMPPANAVSRYFERQADQASLELAGQPEAFVKAEQKMARENKGNVAPTPWNVWIFSTHPTTVERIRMAREWTEKTSTKGTKDTKKEE
jgi:STE24 endopeptidase